MSKNIYSIMVISAFLLSVCAAGCGDDNAGTDAGRRGDGGTDGAVDAGNTIDAGGKVDSGGQDGGVVMCGGAVCKPNYTPACCTADGTGQAGNKLELAGRQPHKCGTDLSQYSSALTGVCLQLNQPGTLDKNCPDVANPTQGQPDMKGCCTDEGFCGAFESFLPLGCEYPGARGKPCGANEDAGH